MRWQVLRRLRSRDAATRVRAATELGRSGARRNIRPLVLALADDARTVRSAAVAALRTVDPAWAHDRRALRRIPLLYFERTITVRLRRPDLAARLHRGSELCLIDEWELEPDAIDFLAYAAEQPLPVRSVEEADDIRYHALLLLSAAGPHPRSMEVACRLVERGRLTAGWWGIPILTRLSASPAAAAVLLAWAGKAAARAEAAGPFRRKPSCRSDSRNAPRGPGWAAGSP